MSTRAFSLFLIVGLALQSAFSMGIERSMPEGGMREVIGALGTLVILSAQLGASIWFDTYARAKAAQESGSSPSPIPSGPRPWGPLILAVAVLLVVQLPLRIVIGRLALDRVLHDLALLATLLLSTLVAVVIVLRGYPAVSETKSFESGVGPK